jgi:hypothetical protein
MHAFFASLSPLAAIATIKQFEIYFLIALGLFIVIQVLLGKVVGKFWEEWRWTRKLGMAR